MKKLFIAACAAVGMFFVAAAAEKWTYDSGTTKLTEITDGTPWVFKVSAQGTLTRDAVGSGAEVDLRVATLPEGVPTIVTIGNMQNTGTCTTFYCPETVTKFDNFSFSGWSALEYIRLPDILEDIGTHAFYNDSKLKTVEPCLPHTVKKLGQRTFQSCSALTNGVEIGYAVDGSGAPLEGSSFDFICCLYGASEIPYLKIGPAVSNAYGSQMFGGNSALGYIEYGERATDFFAHGETLKNSLTNIYFKAEEFSVPAVMFKYSSALRTVEFDGWMNYTPGVDSANPFWCVGDLWCRFVVPLDNVKWRAFIADPTKMTPWADCTTSQKNSYFTKFGNDATVPVGISRTQKSGLPATYIVTKGAAGTKKTVRVEPVDPRFGTVSVSPAADADGFYAAGTEVTITVTPASGVAFRRWLGTTGGIDATSASITVTADSDLSFTPYLESEAWYYDSAKGWITDGGNFLKVSVANATEMTIANALVYNADGIVDLRKPVDGGYTVVALGATAFSEGRGNSDPNPHYLKGVYLPETLTTVGNQCFDTCSNLKFITPCLPHGVANLGERLFQKSGITNLVELGFATDGNGDPITSTLGQYVFWSAGGVSAVRFGPGITAIHNNLFLNATSIGYIEYGPNVENLGSLTLNNICHSTLTNVVFQRTQTTAFPETRYFGNCRKLKEIRWNCWFTYTSGSDTKNPFWNWDELQCRFLYRADNADWIAYAADTEKVQPWAECSDQDKTTYFNRYGQNADTPVGISYAVANGLPRTYIVPDYDNVAGGRLFVHDIDPQNATATISPALPASGFYAEGAEVTVSLALEGGVMLSSWIGDVPAGHETDNPLVLTIGTDDIELTASFSETRRFKLAAKLKPDYLSDYPGGACEPEPAVVDEETGAVLVKGTDYTLSYADNSVAGGTGTVTIHGVGNYSGRTADAEFPIFQDHGVTYTWNKRDANDRFTSGDWEDPANWSPNTGYPAAADDTAILVKAVYNTDPDVEVTVNDPFRLAALTIGEGTGAGKTKLIIKSGVATNEVVGAITVKANGIISHFGPQLNNDAPEHRVALKASTITIENGGSVNVNYLGYGFIKNSKSYGPGAGRDYTSYGGECSTGSGWGSNIQYGSIREPLDYGSSAWYQGAQGGGAVLLIATGAMTIDGTITSCGYSEGTSCGTGGSILLKCGTFAGASTGKIYARGGTGNYAASGGRIAVYLTGAADTSAYLGALTTGNSGYACGTVYIEGNADNPGEGTLIIDNDNRNTDNYYAILSPAVAGSSDPFGRVILKNRGRLRIKNGTTMKVTRGIECPANSVIITDEGGAIELVGSEDFTLSGGSRITFNEFYCTNAPGKTLKFGTTAADRLILSNDKKMILRGTAENKLKLRSVTDGTRWPIELYPNPAVAEFEYLDIQDGDASTRNGFTAISSTDSGNNRNIGFTAAPIAPGTVITWTGNGTAEWNDQTSWDLGRAPVDSDRIVIGVSAGGKYPTLLAGTYRWNSITVQSGATLTFGGASVSTITNNLTVAGTLVFASTEIVYLEGDADFTGGTVNCIGDSKIYFTGTGDRTLDLGDCTFNKLFIEKAGGDVSFGSHGFTAAGFRCDSATRAIEFTFAAGATYTISDIFLNGVNGDEKMVTLKSSTPGTKWNLVGTASGQSLGGLIVSDSDASGGATMYAGTKSVCSNCDNWDTVTAVASWVGGTGSFTDPTGWSSGEVPDENTMVTISAGDGQTLVCTLPAGNPKTVKSLAIVAGAGGRMTFAANSALTVTGGVEIKGNGVLELNTFSDYGEAPNVVEGDLTIRSGGVLSHSGPGTMEANKLHLKVLGSMTVDAGGKVDVTAKGYTFSSGKAYGPGAGRDNGRYAGYTDTAYVTGVCYGSIRNPTNFGSSVFYVGKESPGAIHLVVPGLLTVNGTIKANGEGGTVCGSSGGSVWVQCGTLAGAGSITADGGTCGQYSGSGGRISVAVGTENAFTGTITARCGSTGSTCGTVYIENPGDTSGEGTLIIDNRGQTSNHKTPLNPTIIGSSDPFGKVVVQGYGRLSVESGTTLKVTKGFELGTTGFITVNDGAAIEFVGTEDALVTGGKNITFGDTYATNLVKTIRFGTTANDVLTFPANHDLILSGHDQDNVLALKSAVDDTPWKLIVNADTLVDLAYLAVQDSNAGDGAGLNAIDSTDLGGNTKWSFTAPIVVGAENRWLGEVSSDWGEGGNWELGRAPVETDHVIVQLKTGEYNPVLPSGTYVFNKFDVTTGGELTTQNGVTLTVTNGMNVAGSIVFSGTETVNITGDADFTSASITPAGSYLWINGTGNQTVDLGDATFNEVIVEKSSGNVSFGTHGGTAAYFRCTATAPVRLTFAAGETYDFAQFYLNGLVGNDRMIELYSSVIGTAWKLIATANGQGIGGVTVYDSDASLGAKVYAGVTSYDGSGNTNWDFVSDVASWIGGASGAWNNPANWSSGSAPKAGTLVSIVASDNETIAVTATQGEAMEMGSLMMAAGLNASVSLTCSTNFVVSGDVTMRSGTTLVLSTFDDEGEAPNTIGGDLVMYSGSTLTHQGPYDTERAKLHLKVEGDMDIQAGAAVDVTGKGYTVHHGPGTAGGYQGATHAGHSNVDQQCYGSVFRPLSYGSGDERRSGGGVVHLEVDGTLNVDGTIAADGVNGNEYSSPGGSVLLECGTLTGEGYISAKEGPSGFDNYCSSGGRVAVYETVARDFSRFDISHIAASYNRVTGAGTIYLETADTSKGADLIIEKLGSTAATYYTDIPMSADEEDIAKWANVNLIIGRGARVKILRTGGSASVLTPPQTLKLRSLKLEASDSYLDLNANTLEVLDPDWKRCRGWANYTHGKKWTDYVTSGRIIRGSFEKWTGEIIFLSRGSVLRVR